MTRALDPDTVQAKLLRIDVLVRLLAESGAIDVELLPALRGASGMRNVLVHEYEDIDLDVVAAALGSAVTTFTDLRRQVASWLLGVHEQGTPAERDR